MVSEHGVQSYGCYNAPVDCVACVSGTKVIWMPSGNPKIQCWSSELAMNQKIREVYLFCLLEGRVGEDVLANDWCFTRRKPSHARKSFARSTCLLSL